MNRKIRIKPWGLLGRNDRYSKTLYRRAKKIGKIVAFMEL